MSATRAAVFGDYTQAELDAQYDPRGTVDDLAPYFAYYAETSANAQKSLRGVLDIPYGSSERQRIDLFTGAPGGPVAVFVHGGAWRALSKDDGAFAAECFTQRGAHFAAIDFDLLPEVKLDDMVDQVRAALAWIYESVGDHGGDRERIHVIGHSSGAHLTGMLLASGWHDSVGVPEDLVKGVTLVSGLYDLEPVLLSARREYVLLDEQGEARLSPIRHLDARCPVIVCHAEHDTEEFSRQSRALRDACEERGILGEYLFLEGRNHFDSVKELATPDGELARAVFRQMRL